jgi:hypothetical protein
MITGHDEARAHHRPSAVEPTRLETIGMTKRITDKTLVMQGEGKAEAKTERDRLYEMVEATQRLLPRRG